MIINSTMLLINVNTIRLFKIEIGTQEATYVYQAKQEDKSEVEFFRYHSLHKIDKTEDFSTFRDYLQPGNSLSWKRT